MLSFVKSSLARAKNFACTTVALKTLILVERVFLRVRVFIAAISRHVESLIIVAALQIK